jgi:hypothetical protein
MEAQAGGKACSLKWANIRMSLKVSMQLCTPTEFMRRCNMNDEQIKAVYVLCETDAPNMDMLAALQDDDLETFGLKKVQAQTWKRLAAKL